MRLVSSRVATALSAKVAKGLVVGQRPKARARRPNGAKVRLVISRGKRR